MAKAKLKKRVKKVEEEVKDEAVKNLSIEALVVKHKTLFVGGAVAVIVAILGIIALQMWNKGQNAEASEMMFQAVKYFEVDSFELALNGDPAGNLGLMDIAADYSYTDAGNMAKYYIGIIHLKRGELEEGVDYLKSVSLPSGSMMAVSGNMALGFAYEDLGDPLKAANYFEKAANAIESNEYTTPMVLMNAGRNYEAAGDRAKALKSYQRIKDEFPLSSEGRQIDKYIGRVTE